MYKRLIWLVGFMILLMLALVYRAVFLVTPSEEGIENLGIQMIDQAVLFEKQIDNLRMQMIDQAALFEKGIDNLRTQMIDQTALSKKGIDDLRIQMIAQGALFEKDIDELQAKEFDIEFTAKKTIEPPVEKATDPLDHSDHDDISCKAWTAAKILVLDHLTAANTASFGKRYEQKKCDDMVTSLGNDRYRVTGFVDSQNGFVKAFVKRHSGSGPIIRSYFTMEIMYYRGQWMIMAWKENN